MSMALFSDLGIETYAPSEIPSRHPDVLRPYASSQLRGHGLAS